MANPYPPALEFRAVLPQMFDNDAGDQVQVVGRVQRPGLVNSVEIIPNWSMSGANTNSRTYTLKNLGASGVGTAVVATLALTSGVNLSKGVAKVITLGDAADRDIVVGDILVWESTRVGTGLPDPGGLIVVQQSSES